MEREKKQNKNPFLNIINLSKRKKVKEINQNKSINHLHFIKKISLNEQENKLKCSYAQEIYYKSTLKNEKKNIVIRKNIDKSTKEEDSKAKPSNTNKKIITSLNNIYNTKLLENTNSSSNDEQEIKKIKNLISEKDTELQKVLERINILKNENTLLNDKINQYKEEINSMEQNANYLSKETLGLNEEEASNSNSQVPNVDNMNYEELLELEEKMGYVNKGFTKEQIDKIPIIVYKNDNKCENNESIKCVICQYDICEGNNIKKLSCGHIFHSNCIDNWLLKEKRCSFCKQEVVIP